MTRKRSFVERIVTVLKQADLDRRIQTPLLGSQAVGMGCFVLQDRVRTSQKYRLFDQETALFRAEGTVPSCFRIAEFIRINFVLNGQAMCSSRATYYGAVLPEERQGSEAKDNRRFDAGRPMK
jgi:hypothetical protein